MTYTVNSTTAETWDTSGFAWQDFTAQVQTWNTANATVGTLALAETLNNADAIKKAVSLHIFAEAVTVTDALASKAVTKAFSEAVHFADTFTRVDQFHITIAEGVTITDDHYFHLTKVFYEAVATLEVRYLDLTKVIAESAHVVDAFDRVAAYHLMLGEALTTTDITYKHFTKPLTDSWKQVDHLIQYGNKVIADLQFKNAPITYTQFQSGIAGTTPTSYQAFQPFMIGDYDYSRILVRVTLQRENTEQDLRLLNLEVQADVQNVWDSDVTTITSTSGPTTIAFNKSFLAPPEVTISNISGSVVLVASIVSGSISRTQFQVNLTDVSGVRQTGTIQWQATGW